MAFRRAAAVGVAPPARSSRLRWDVIIPRTRHAKGTVEPLFFVGGWHELGAGEAGRIAADERDGRLRLLFVHSGCATAATAGATRLLDPLSVLVVGRVGARVQAERSTRAWTLDVFPPALEPALRRVAGCELPAQRAVGFGAGPRAIVCSPRTLMLERLTTGTLAGGLAGCAVARRLGVRLIASVCADAGAARRGLAPAALDRARRLIALRYAEALPRDLLARAGHISAPHLARLFRHSFGISPHRYLTRLRLRLALEALTPGSRSLDAVAQSLGYATHSHFSSRFRAEFGCSPRRLRAVLRRLDRLRSGIEVDRIPTVSATTRRHHEPTSEGAPSCFRNEESVDG